MPRPPAKENKTLTWPDWPLKLRTSSSHEEGCERDWAVVTKRAIGSNGKIEALECVRIEWVKSDDGRMEVKEIPCSEFQLKADLVLLAMGFLGPRKSGMIEQSRSEEHTSELQSLMRISYAFLFLKNKSHYTK